MKKILLLLSACFCLSGCTTMIIGLALGTYPQSRMSFKVNGETFKAEDGNLGTFRIVEVDAEGFSIAYSGSEWDTNNSLDGVVIGLNCGFFDGDLKKDEEYVFTEDDEMDAYPIFRYTVTEVIESTSESSVTRSGVVCFNATEGWFKITKLNVDDGTISGKFAFTAVCDDPSSGEIVEITDGVLKNVPYILVQDNY